MSLGKKGNWLRRRILRMTEADLKGAAVPKERALSDFEEWIAQAVESAKKAEDSWRVTYFNPYITEVEQHETQEPVWGADLTSVMALTKVLFRDFAGPIAMSLLRSGLKMVRDRKVKVGGKVLNFEVVAKVLKSYNNALGFKERRAVGRCGLSVTRICQAFALTYSNRISNNFDVVSPVHNFPGLPDKFQFLMSPYAMTLQELRDNKELLKQGYVAWEAKVGATAKEGKKRSWVNFVDTYLAQREVEESAGSSATGGWQQRTASGSKEPIAASSSSSSSSSSRTKERVADRA